VKNVLVRRKRIKNKHWPTMDKGIWSTVASVLRKGKGGGRGRQSREKKRVYRAEQTNKKKKTTEHGKGNNPPPKGPWDRGVNYGEHM